MCSSGKRSTTKTCNESPRNTVFSNWSKSSGFFWFPNISGLKLAALGDCISDYPFIFIENTPVEGNGTSCRDSFSAAASFGPEKNYFSVFGTKVLEISEKAA
jgi:hypothetical protein